jgi:hypothetical protein
MGTLDPRRRILNPGAKMRIDRSGGRYRAVALYNKWTDRAKPDYKNRRTT